MSTLTLLVAVLAVAVIGGYIFRLVGQKFTNNRPYFRDMPFLVAFGYVFGALLIVLCARLYLQPTTLESGVPNAVTIFFRWTVHLIAALALAAFLFRLAGRNIGSDGSKRLFRQMPMTASFGVLTILLYCIVAIIPDVFAPYGEAEVFAKSYVYPFGNEEANGDPAHMLGTDEIGRDILSRLIFATQNTMFIALAATILAFVIGGVAGLAAAIFGGWVDSVISRTVDVLMAIPALIFQLLLLSIASFWANSYGIPMVFFMIVIIAVIDSTRVFRLARSVGLGIVAMDYIEAAKLRGEKLGYLITREILPNAMPPFLVEFGLRFCFVFLTIASLSFLGMGIQPPSADWGTMVRKLADFIKFAQFLPNAALLPLFPALAIAILVLAVNFVVDWILDKSSGLKG
ncbi:MAG: ABC transporter permease [Pseudomonadota bacterium]